MKKTVLVVLMMVMLGTPCLAQEVEPNGLFSIEGTRWRTCEISASIEFGFDDNHSGFDFSIGCPANSYGLYEEKVYSCSEDTRCLTLRSYSYIDTPLVGIAHSSSESDLLDVDLFIMQPGGFGVHTSVQEHFRMHYWYPDTNYESWKITFRMGIMFKLDNNWEPPEDILIDDIDIIPPDETDPWNGGIIIQPIPNFPPDDNIYNKPLE